MCRVGQIRIFCRIYTVYTPYIRSIQQEIQWPGLATVTLDLANPMHVWALAGDVGVRFLPRSVASSALSPHLHACPMHLVVLCVASATSITATIPWTIVIHIIWPFIHMAHRHCAGRYLEAALQMGVALPQDYHSELLLIYLQACDGGVEGRGCWRSLLVCPLLWPTTCGHANAVGPVVLLSIDAALAAVLDAAASGTAPSTTFAMHAMARAHSSVDWERHSPPLAPLPRTLAAGGGLGCVCRALHPTEEGVVWLLTGGLNVRAGDPVQG